MIFVPRFSLCLDSSHYILLCEAVCGCPVACGSTRVASFVCVYVCESERRVWGMREMRKVESAKEGLGSSEMLGRHVLSSIRVASCIHGGSPPGHRLYRLLLS